MVEVINMSNKTIEVAGIEIKPHNLHLFDQLSDFDEIRLRAMSVVKDIVVNIKPDNKIEEKSVIENIEPNKVNNNKPKSNKKSKKK